MCSSQLKPASGCHAFPGFRLPSFLPRGLPGALLFGSLEPIFLSYAELPGSPAGERRPIAAEERDGRPSSERLDLSYGFPDSFPDEDSDVLREGFPDDFPEARAADLPSFLRFRASGDATENPKNPKYRPSE